MRPPRERRRVRLLLANLHASSNPAAVVPWLLALALALRADVCLLQEVTDRHARWLSRLPRWGLVRLEGDEAILGRRRHLAEAGVLGAASTSWRGHHTGEAHKPRTIPTALIRGWLRVLAVHYPPGWEAGPDDRRQAGAVYMTRLEGLLETPDHRGAPVLLGGDWNALRLSRALRASWRASGLRSYGRGIDYVACSPQVRVTAYRRVGRAPGMDHAAVFVIARPSLSKAPTS